MKKSILGIVLAAIFCMTACKKEDQPTPAQVTTLSASVSDTEAICWGKVVKGSSEISAYGIVLDGVSHCNKKALDSRKKAV